MSGPRSARTVDNPDGTKTLRVPCQGVNPTHLPPPEPETVPCQNEKRYVLTTEQVALYIDGAPLTDIWDVPDEYVWDPWCDEHRLGGL